ncbi:hypothetical protein G7046_g470 [Stylonectria norvegica]|nr:hypothetical protein G7046_g470 [Stylonectria norvegica]
MAEYLVPKNTKVLKHTAQEFGAPACYLLDTGNVSEIPASVQQITSEHPELDCLISHAGVQRPLRILQDENFLARTDEEIGINIRGPMHLALALLTHLRFKSNATSIVNGFSVLGFIPTSVVNPVYNGTKAWLHFWNMNLGTRLLKNGGNRTALSIEDFKGGVSKKKENGGWGEIITAGQGDKTVEKWPGVFGEIYDKPVNA